MLTYLMIGLELCNVIEPVFVAKSACQLDFVGCVGTSYVPPPKQP